MSDRYWYREILNNIQCFLLDINNFYNGIVNVEVLDTCGQNFIEFCPFLAKKKQKNATGLRRILQTNVLKSTFTLRKTGEFTKPFAIGPLFLPKINL